MSAHLIDCNLLYQFVQKFPDLKFKYVEEDAPEEFFIPYVWTLVTKYGCVHFNSEGNKGVSSEISC